MKIAIIVSSNVVKDPRVVKQAAIAKNITDDYLVIGKHDENVTDERLNKLGFNVNLIKQQSKDSLVSKAITRISFGFKLMNLLRKENPNVIHANDFDMLFFSYFIKKRHQLLIYDAHEIYAKNGKIAKIKLLSSFVKMLEKHMIKKVDYFITVSNAAKDYYQQNKYSKTPVVITNVPIKEEFTPLPKSEDFKVLYQGIISEGRGYEEFAESARYLKEFDEIKLVIRGYGPTLDEIKKIKDRFNLDNLFIEDPVEMDQMIIKASECNVGIVMTKPISENYEYTISNKFFEYLHAGLPVIVSPVKEHQYLIDKYMVGEIVDEVTPEYIAEKIKKIYLNKKLYKEQLQKVNSAIETLNWQSESKKLIAMYKGNYEK